ncbi:MAG: NAD-dependent epimerase/dehydratase family protein [Kiritimatiellia bacterium]|nr:NAD-dependent epimerase/dehydratase family protein [Kiritimatiellia bacterium]
MNHLPLNDVEHILLHTKGLWGELRGSKVFITGGTGFFGKWLLESFLAANDKFKLKASITVLSRNPEKFEREAPRLAGHPAVHFIKGDVRNFVFPKGRFTHLIHGAADASLKLIQKEPLLIFDTIIQGTKRILEFAGAHGVKKMLFISSGAVYGRQPSDLAHIPEDYRGAPDPMDTHSAYGEGKRAAETLCALFGGRNGPEIKIARCFTFVGPYLPPDASFAVGNFIRDGLKGGPIQIKGNGTACRSYLYAADLAVWLWTILFKGKSCFPYNVGSDKAVTMADLANLVADQFEPRLRVAIGQKQAKGLAGERYIPAIRRARRELGLRPVIKLPEAVQRTINWFRCNAGG